MHKRFIVALAAAAVLPLQFATATAAEVEVRTASDLVNICSIADDDARVEGARGFCYGFLSGAAQYHQSVNAGKKANHCSACRSRR